MRTVVSTSEVPHLWANQIQEHARNHGNLYFEGKKIWSYGRHFLAAKIINDNTVTINNYSYSVTTSGHLRAIESAIDKSKFTNIFHVPEPDVKIGKHHNHDTNIKHLFNGIELYSNKIKTARSNKAGYIRSVEMLKKLILEYCRVFKCKTILSSAQRTILNAPIEQLESKFHKKYKKETAQRKLAEKKRIKRNEDAFIESCEKFRRFEIDHVNDYNQSRIVLRVNRTNNVVETSQGVNVPVDRAIELWPLVLHCHNTKTEWIENGQNFKIGHYRVNKIHSNGDLKAGCHFLKFDELQRIAINLNITSK
jgi:hypothetical protein